MLNIKEITALMVVVNMAMLLLSSIYFIWTVDSLALKVMGTNIVLIIFLMLIRQVIED